MLKMEILRRCFDLGCASKSLFNVSFHTFIACQGLEPRYNGGVFRV